MKISIIIPSYNQKEYIRETLENVVNLKLEQKQNGVSVELILIDNCSDNDTKSIINKYSKYLDYYESSKDKGQYDAINKGLDVASGKYWTWLNTDDLLCYDGLSAICRYLKQDETIDYIYGNVKVIDKSGEFISILKPNNLTLNGLTNEYSSITQPGSFFRKEFTDSIGKLKPYDCCFDYEYVLRVLKNKGKVYYINETVAFFRYYSDSKSGSKKKTFIDEINEISQIYGRKKFSKLTYVLTKELVKWHIKKIINY